MSYDELKKLDHRELMALFREAQVKEIEKSLNLLAVIRASLAKADEYKSVASALRKGIVDIRMGVKESVKQAWSDLRRGK